MAILGRLIGQLIGSFFIWLYQKLSAILATRVGQWISSGIVLGVAEFTSGVLADIDNLKAEAIAFLHDGFSGLIAQYALEHYGITVDPNDPFSSASVSGAITQKTGIPITDIYNKESVLNDLGLYVAGQINGRLGTTFSTVYPVETFQAEIEDQVMALINNEIDQMQAEALQ